MRMYSAKVIGYKRSKIDILNSCSGEIDTGKAQLIPIMFEPDCRAIKRYRAFAFLMLPSVKISICI